jgi:hypothetical protein
MYMCVSVCGGESVSGGFVNVCECEGEYVCVWACVNMCVWV